MDLIKCPRCGERYSPSYRKCPFCEEEERPRKAASRRGGHHVSEKKQTHSARAPLAVVLVVVLALLSWYLFGGSLMEKQQSEEPNLPIENNEDQGGVQDDLGYDPSIGDEPDITDSDDPAPPVVAEPDEPDAPEEPDAPAQTVDVSALSLKTNVGKLSKAPGTEQYDCSIKLSDNYIKLVVQGTDAQATWASADESVVKVASDGTLTPVKVGMTTVTANVGGAELACIVRVK